MAKTMRFKCDACQKHLDVALEASFVPEEYFHLGYKKICKLCAAKQRTCTGHCKKTYPAIERYFYPNRTSHNKYGLYPICKACASRRAAISRVNRLGLFDEPAKTGS